MHLKEENARLNQRLRIMEDEVVRSRNYSSDPGGDA